MELLILLLIIILAPIAWEQVKKETTETAFDLQDKAIKYLQEYIKPYMTTFEGQTFLDWCNKNSYKISPTLHPLEEAHRAGADYMITVFDKQNTNDRWHLA